MKKISYNIPNAASLFVIITLALATTGCGTTNEPTTATNPDASGSGSAGGKNSAAVASVTILPTADKAGYKDGTYSAVGNYNSPGGPEEIGVSVTLKNNLITNASVEVKATRRKSLMVQQDFADHFKPFVIGKNINEVKLDKVSGSSLTPAGFNDAIAKIKAQAK